jgi:Holliday junction DNA helicase RuvA
MIALLRGKVHYRGTAFLFVDTGAVGYKVNVPEWAVGEFSGDVSLYIHQVNRDDATELFGFKTIEALELFWKLSSISGLGPRSAQKIVFCASVDEVKAKIMQGDLDFLTSVPGIGKKTAQKVILELKGVLVEEAPAISGDTDALDALMALGYTRKQAEDALAAVEGDSTDARIKAALKRLGKA